MAEILLIRHSLTAGNMKGRYIGKTDEPLCEEGKELLKDFQIEEAEWVYVSPMKRCLETAERLFPLIGKTVIEDLRECDFGEFENKNYKELSGNCSYQAWVDSGGQMPFPGGEDPFFFRRRCCSGFEEMMRDGKEKKWKRAAAVVHGGTIMSIMEMYGFPGKDFYEWQVKNAEGYLLKVDPLRWNIDRQVQILGKVSGCTSLE